MHAFNILLKFRATFPDYCRAAGLVGVSTDAVDRVVRSYRVLSRNYCVLRIITLERSEVDISAVHHLAIMIELDQAFQRFE